MINTNKVPSAEEVLKQKDNGRLYHVLQAYRLDEAVIEIMEKYTRLHLEAMRDEIINTQYGPTRESINYIANTYIKNKKL